MANYSTEVMVWTFYFEKPNKKLDQDRLAEFDEAMEESFGTAIDSACAKYQVPPTKAHRSQILALAIITRGSELKERVLSATRFYKNHVLANEIL